MRKILIILFLAIAAFGLSQNLKVPEVSLNSVILPLGGELEFDASNLNDGSYKLVFTGPSGQSITEELKTNNGKLNYKLLLDESGNWEVALHGQDLDLKMNVAVMPPVANKTTGDNNTDAKVAAEAETKAVTSEKPEEPKNKLEAPEENKVTSEPEVAVKTESQTAETTVSNTAAKTVNAEDKLNSNSEEAVTAPEVKTQTDVADDKKDIVDDKQADEVTASRNTLNTNSSTAIAQTEPAEETDDKDKTAETAVTENTALDADKQLSNQEDATAVGSGRLSTDSNKQEAEENKTEAPVSEENAKQENVAVNEETSTTTNTENKQALFSNLSADKFSLSGSSLQGKAGDKPVWKLDFPANSGKTAKIVIETDDAVYIGHGNSLLRVNKADGKVLARWLVSGQIDSLEKTPLGLDIWVKLSDGTKEKFSLVGNNLDKAAHFDTNPELFKWLENESNVSNPSQRLVQDPSNPWLYIKAGQSNNNLSESKNLYNNAIDAANSFYDLAGISRNLLEQGESGLSTKAFNKALKDFAARGYDPRALTDMKLHNAYNFPLEALNSAVKAGDLEKAKVLAEQLKYFLSPSSPEVRKALISYANLLKKNGDKEAAKEWYKIAKSANRSSVTNILDRIFASLGGIAWYAALSTLLAGFFLRLVLLFKYWRAQSLMLKRKQESGKKVSPISRLFAVRYYSFTEKLVLNLLLFTTLILVALGTWDSKVSKLPEAVNSGSFANASVQNFINNADLKGSQGNFIKGYMAQLNNQRSEAEKYYKAAADYPAAINNLAALSGDKTLYEEALKRAKNLPEALYNSGKEPDLLPFQKEYLAPAPALVVPNKEDFQAALSGNWQDAISRVFVNPLEFLKDLSAANPFKLKNKLLNTIFEYFILALFLLYALWTILWLFIPRPRLARNAPRSFIYHILAFLIPGSGLADEMWGILLLVPWAIVGIDAVSRFFGWGVTLNGLSLRWDIYILAAIYIINLIALVIEFLSYRQRMIKLKTEDPELAREFNLIN